MNNEGAIFVLKTLRDMHLGAVNSDALAMAISALEKQESEKWHPLNPDGWNSYPNNDRLVMVSFHNMDGVAMARFCTDEKGGGFYPRGEDETYAQFGIFVSAWRELPERYNEDKE